MNERQKTQRHSDSAGSVSGSAMPDTKRNDPNPSSPSELMKTFSTGAIRSASGEKMAFDRFFDSRVMKRCAEYLQTHRLCPDGSVRDPDNWKKGIPVDSYVGSLHRHYMDVWLWNQGYQEEMTESIHDSLCAIVFNAHGLLFELLRSEDVESQDV